MKIATSSIPTAWEHAIGALPNGIRPSTGMTATAYTMNIWVQQGTGFVYVMGTAPQIAFISYPLGT